MRWGGALVAVLSALTWAQPLTVPRARSVLFLEGEGAPPCEAVEPGAAIDCLIAARYAESPAAAKVARALYRDTGTVVGQLPEQDFDGGYRGQLHLVPRLPVGPHLQHLTWLAHALGDFDDFFRQLGGAPAYRWRDLEVRFFESVRRRTPSAFAVDWLVAWNVSGSLFTSEASARATLFHEVFHLNDQAHRNWSRRALQPIFDTIVTRCAARTECLTPFTPDLLKVKGGTYYAFQPGNGVHEYAADLARRYYLEHRALLRHERPLRPFKCGPEENRKAWALLVAEFFGGVDLVPDCGKSGR